MSNAVSLIEEAYTAHYDLIYNTCYNRLKNHEDAEDALQDTFELALRYSHTFNPNKAAIHTWLNRIAINRCSLILNSVKRKGMSVELTDENLGADEMDLDKGVMLKHAKDKIGEVREPVIRSALHLYFFDRAKPDEIAAILDVKTGVVYSWVYKFLNSLKEV